MPQQKKKNHVSFVELQKQVDAPEPLVVEVAPGVELTFHDPFGGAYDQDFEMPDKPREQMIMLLGEEAFEAFEEKGVTIDGRTYVAIAQKVMEHFQLGEGNASRT